MVRGVGGPDKEPAIAVVWMTDRRWVQWVSPAPKGYRVARGTKTKNPDTYLTTNSLFKNASPENREGHQDDIAFYVFNFIIF